jgi:cell division protein FtsL
MHVFMSWARSTLTNVDRTLGRTERHFDALLVVVMLVLALASIFLFSQ